jgi:hypothetical protein
VDKKNACEKTAADVEHTGKERGVTSEHVADVCSTVGNLIRIALAVELDEAQAACAAAAQGRLESLILDPRQDPQTNADDLQNQRVLQAFLEFRMQLQIARAGFQFDGATPC